MEAGEKMPITVFASAAAGSESNACRCREAPPNHRMKSPLPCPALITPLLLLALLLGGCGTPAAQRDDEAARREIRSRIAAIRDAILARNAAGIVQSATPDWSFTGPDGVAFDREGFLRRTEALFARIVTIESLTTDVDTVEFTAADRARVEITQTMVRSERAADTGTVSRVWLRYREEHSWVQVDGAWKVRRVVFIGTPERRVLTP